MNEIAPTNDFDYSVLDTTTKEFLEERANIIYGIQSKSAYEIGKQLARAQEKLSQNRYGCFEEWYRSLGFKKTKAYEYINHYNFIRSQSEQLNIEKFEELPSKLQAEMSKPSANPEVNQAVFDGDVKTHKEYKELERRLKLKDQALEAVKGELERTRLVKPTEKVIEKEVIPDDYKATQELNKQLLAKNKELSDSEQAANERVQFIESQLKELMNQRQEVDEKSAKYDELTRAIEQSQGQLDSYQKQVSAYRDNHIRGKAYHAINQGIIDRFGVRRKEIPAKEFKNAVIFIENWGLSDQELKNEIFTANHQGSLFEA